VITFFGLLIAGLRVIVPQDSKDKLELWRTLLAHRRPGTPTIQSVAKDTSQDNGGEGRGSV
jgi:hypothetical protein